ncbi:MAG: hypothetical protein A2041_03365 [Bacteroidetes bacterium GWA2_31_9b]|nr:MAG: hypothetical protein A2041_03365 [Bacteroidetes bacterium GWA2_31_9b]
MNIHEIIKSRYSPVVFSSIKIDDEKLLSLFEAARWAPSSFNEQPWRFIQGKKNEDDNYDKLLKSLVDGNRYWAQHAPVLILVVAKTKFSHNNSTNQSALYDTGLAVGNLLTQATDQGLFVHQMGGFNKELVKKDFEIPEYFEPIAIMAVGYKGNLEDFPVDIQQREKRIRTRKPLESFFKMS